MKKIILTVLLATLGFIAVAQEQKEVIVSEIEQTGIDMQRTLSADGSEIIERPFKWFAGIGVADQKQVALKMANREAYVTISSVIERIVESNCEQAELIVNGKVQNAVRSYWKQVTQSILKGCTPYGKAEVEYDPETKMYTVIAKVAIRGDRYMQMLGTAEEIPAPSGLNKSETEEFIDVNRMIIEAARGE